VSDVEVNDSSPEASPEGSAVVVVPVDSLLASDSPRLAGENTDHIRLLAESDNPLPPIVVHRRTMRVIDGMHRLRAAVLGGRDTVAVRFFDGDSDEAFVLAVQENTAHGLPLTAADRTAAAERILLSHVHWSDRAIAAVAGISAKTVGTIRARATAGIPQLHARVGRDGKVRPLDQSEGRIRAVELIQQNPEIKLRELARGAGVSVGTARDVRDRLRRGDDPVPPRLREGLHKRLRVAENPGAGKDGDGQVFDIAAAVSNLRNDPSLRFTEAGRVLLRLLDLHTARVAQLSELANTVPSHWVNLVAEVAGECAQAWQEFAVQLQRRQEALA